MPFAMFDQPMDEARKKTLCVMTAIFLSRRLEVLLEKSSPKRETVFREAFELAEEVMKRIDQRWPRNPADVARVPAQRMNSTGAR
jgi:hypothetical protein